MKKTALIIALVACLVISVFAAVACDQNPEQHTVTFKLGEETIETKKVDDNGVISPLPTLSSDKIPEDKNFDGWFVGETQFTTETKVTSDLTVVAKFSKKHNITFKCGDEIITTKTVSDNGFLSELPTLSENKIPDDQYFDGWFVGEELFTTATKVTTDLTVVAKLSKKLTVTFILNGETYETVGNQKVNSTINLLPFSTFDYEVMEWVDENNVKYDYNDVYTVKGDTTLTAVDPKPINFTMKKATNGDYYMIAGLLNMSSEELTVPETFLGLPVKEIAPMAFSGLNNTLKKLTVGSNIEKIGRQAFAGLFALNELTVPFLGEELYTTVDGHNEKGVLAYWFAADEPMSAIYKDYFIWAACFFYEDQQPETAMEAFIPKSFEKLTVNGGVICNYAFNNVKSLKTINLGDEVTEIGSRVFTIYPNYVDLGDSNLEEINCTENSKITAIGENIISYQPHFRKFCVAPKVQIIHPYLFYYIDTLEELVLFDNSELKEIGMQAFFGTSISELDLPVTVTTIGAMAFGSCKKLESVSIPALAVNLDGAIFSGCEKLSSVTFAVDNSITELPARMFEGCLLLSNINVPNGVVKLNSDAFSNCPLLNIDISKFTYIGDGALRNTAIVNANLNKDIEYIGIAAFSSCSKLKAVNFATETSKLTEIADSTFDDCWQLSNIELPDCVTRIGVRAFSYTGLVSVKLPANLEIIDDRAFLQFNEEYSSLTTITNLSTLTKLVKIGDSAFYNNSKLVITSLPDCLQTIGRQAFQNTKLQGTITIDPKVTTAIGENAFSECSLATIEIVGTSDDVPRKWHASWAGLNDKAVNFTYTNESTDYTELFDGFTGYTTDGTYYVTGYNGSENTLILKDEHNGAPIVYRKGVFNGNKNIKSVTLAANMTTVPKEFFSNCSSLTDVIIPENSKITSIGDYAFNMCNSLVSLTIADASELTSIGDYAFYGANNVKFIDLLNNSKIEYIGDYAFHVKYSAVDISLARMNLDLSKVTYIGDYAFYGNNKLTASYTIPATIETLGEAAFNGCQKLELTLADGFKLTRYENNVFTSISKLTWINLDATTVFTGVEYIGDNAFAGTQVFAGQRIVIPNTVKYIGASAFSKGGATCAVIDCNNELIIGNYAFDINPNGFWLLIKGAPAKIGEEICGGIKNAHIYFTETIEEIREPASWNPSVLRLVGYKLGESECEVSVYFAEYDYDNDKYSDVPYYGAGEWTADENGDPIHPDDEHKESGSRV